METLLFDVKNKMRLHSFLSTIRTKSHFGDLYLLLFVYRGYLFKEIPLDLLF